ncbi:VWA domain-containing protein [Treponema sp. OMZ 799]|uniref:VWA domain-containing protein n=1 Tax=Treponema sp. OMZ 799 TaxID=2563668 RepID=UPI0020A34949|nr:VWA domain-containing protein [Treponema sp. OMZ 799]UTC77682.1 VWA domain-containing protein [Treponema sp. OMZ 799]
MNKRERNSRNHTRKALQALQSITDKYPKGIKDIASISEEFRAWIQVKVLHLRECLKKTRFASKPEWWEDIRLSRNKAAHKTEDMTDTEFADLCNTIFTKNDTIKQNLENNLNRYKQPSKKKRKFENSASPALGSPSERKQIVDALEDAIQPIEPKEIAIEFPQNIFAQAADKAVSEILSRDDIKDYALNHTGVSENIQTDILEWLQTTQSTLEKENPFFEEEIFLAQQKKRSAQDIALDLSDENSKIQYHYKRLPSVSNSKRGNIAESLLNFDFYKKAFSEQKQIVKKETAKIKEKEEFIVQWKSKEELEALRRNFIADMEKELIKRKIQWELEKIEAMRKSFLEKLYEKIKNFIRLEKLLSPFIKDLGRLWDLSQQPFETSGFEILESFAQLLEQDVFLQELAALLGTQSRAQTLFEKELRDKTVIKTEWHPKTAYRGEINGLCYSNDISAALPAELAMLKNPAAEKLFQLKFAQKQLLSFDYQNYAEKEKEIIEQEEVSVEKQEPKGPIIICVDTSGSMHGAPEQIAKTVTFALAKIAMNEKRSCYLISFSTGIETLDLSSFKGADALSKLVQFLRMSFNGGTDAAPALTHAVKQLQTNEWKNADVLMVSDFVMGELPAGLEEKIKAEQEKETGFYSLVIGSDGNKQTLKAFNENWNYNPGNTDAQKELVRQLDSLRRRKTKN